MHTKKTERRLIMTMKEYNSVKETLERLLPEDSKLRTRILGEFYEAKRKIAKIGANNETLYAN
jgi:hypothetical protein